MRTVNWLRPLAFAVAKSMGVTDKAMVKSLRDSWKNQGKYQFDEPLAMEDRAYKTGHHIALGSELIDWLMQMKVDNAIQSGGWHLPYKAARIGVEQDSAAEPMLVAWLQVHEVKKALSPLGFADADQYSDDDWLLYVGIHGVEPDGETPTMVRALLDTQQIAEFFNGYSPKDSGGPNASVGQQEGERLRRAVQLTVALGIYLSIDGIEPERVPKPREKKVAPPPRDRSNNYQLTVLTKRPLSGGDRAAHVVRPHVRRLQDDRYYQGKWRNWPKGTRYVLVSSHIRGADAATRQGASERDQSARRASTP